MATLKQKIRIAKDKNDELKAHILKISGYSSTSALNRVLNVEEKEFDYFNNLIKMVQELFPNEEKELLDGYFRTIDPKKKTARYALEYASINRLDELLKYLIDKMEYCGNKQSEEWARIYKFDIEAGNKKIESFDAIAKISQMKFKDEEPRVFSRLIQMYEYYNLRMLPQLNDLVRLVEYDIDNINEEFIRESYFSRLGLAMAGINLHQNDIQKCRKFADMALSNTSKNTIVALVSLQKGNSFIFESFEKAMESFKIALKNSEGYGLKENEVKKSVNFLQNYWGVTPSFLPEVIESIGDVHTLAFYNIRINNISEALRLLDTINQDDMSNSQRGFHNFYRGLATGEKSYFIKSVTSFKLAEDKFYRQLPLIELHKLGLDEDIIQALSI